MVEEEEEMKEEEEVEKEEEEVEEVNILAFRVVSNRRKSNYSV